ncbi:MAG: diacylglycerol kinase family lipid kinase [Thermomicrobiales bacterium]
MSTPLKALAILNPATGAVSLRRVRQLLSNQARRSGIELEFAETEYADHAFEIVQQRRDEFGLIVAVGGDGTVSEVAAGAVGTDVAIGIVPTGSTNMVAKELGIPRFLSQAVRVALTSENVIVMDVAQANDNPFIHMGGAGFDAAIMRETSRTLKRIFRWLAYIGPGLAQLRRKPFKVKLELDGEHYEFSARMVLLALGGSIVHPRFRVGNGIDRTDGILDVVVFDPSTFWRVATTFAWMAIRKPERSPWHHHFRCLSATLESDEAVPFELDGSYRGELPVQVKMLDQGVFVRVPTIPTPGEIEAHLNARLDRWKVDYEISSGRVAV